MNFDDLQTQIQGTALQGLSALLSADYLAALKHGDLPRWQALLAALPKLTPSIVDLQSGVSIGRAEDCSAEVQMELQRQLRQLIPWRKGPFRLFDIGIDTEWDSGMKWQRLLPHIQSLEGRRVLDVGCGNGYHCLRMAGAGARLVVGVEPYLLYVMQFWAIKNYLPGIHSYVIPASLEQLPDNLQSFDSVFSMGVLYHVKSPIDHLMSLRRCLRKSGELVLETLVVEGGVGYSLMPESRYARMSNVWFIPSCGTLVLWLQRCGFTNIQIANTSVTTVTEQHKTEWMPFESLADSLDVSDASRTIEGLPAPQRAILTCTAP